MPFDIQPRILFEDYYLLVVNKPAGWSVEGRDSVKQTALEYLQKQMPHRKRLVVGPLHRLDRPVSGVLLMAKTPKALQALHGQFATRKIDKVYLAVVAKPMENEQGILEHWLGKDDAARRAVLASADHPGARHCALKFRTLASAQGFHLLEIKLLTGRYHQIRAQLAAVGNPVVGDVKYGYATHLDDPMAICLHAYRLAFYHPKTGEKMEVEAPAPKEGPWLAFRRLL